MSLQKNYLCVSKKSQSTHKMSLFHRIFLKKADTKNKQPNIRFGRYSDSYKQAEKLDAWDIALTAFEKGDYMDSYRAFFHYLRDDTEQNVQTSENNNEIIFTILQGSKKIVGVATPHFVKAEVKIAKSTTLNVTIMRRLMEANARLDYCRYALDDQNRLVMTFSSASLDGSPYKIYYALKEMAVRADKLDDLLLDEFDTLEAIEIEHLSHLPNREKQVKYQFIVGEISSVFDRIENSPLNVDQHPKSVGYMLLSLAYKLDYLTKPEGFMMDILEGIHRIQAEEAKSMAQKNQMIQKRLTELLNREKQAFFKEMYQAPLTFGIVNAAPHERFADFVQNELAAMQWYIDLEHFQIAKAIPDFVVGYALFNYVLPHPDRDLLHLYYEISEHEYFYALGFTNDYVNKEGQLNAKAIKAAIKKIAEKHIARYPTCKPDVQVLDFSSLLFFVRSYVYMIGNTNIVQ
jgi:hypothetical protein